MLNSSDPLVKDRGLVPSRDHETSLALHRKNSIQKEHLGRELLRLDREQRACIRKTHLEKCALSRNLATDLTKLTVADDACDDDGSGGGDQTNNDEVTKSPKTARRKLATVAMKNGDQVRRISLPEELPEIASSSTAAKRDVQQRFLDRKLSREINKLKKASTTNESDERKGKPRIPPNAWHHDDDQSKKGRERSSVFDRLSMETNVNSMSSEQFLQRVRQRRQSHPLPQASPTRTRRNERR